MAVIGPEPISIIATFTLHDVIGVIRLGYFIIRVNHNLQYIISGFDVSDVDPLAIDVVSVRVPAAHCDPLSTEISTRITLLYTFVTLAVLQAEAGFVTFGHFSAVHTQKVVVSENLHAVVVPVTVVPLPGMGSSAGSEVAAAVVVDLRGEAQQSAVRGRVCRVGAVGETLLLMSALQSVHRPVLQIRGVFNNLCV